METNKTCKYCKLELRECISEGLDCIICAESIHLKCLEKGTVPGELNGDVFYTFTCKECSPTNEEIFLRDGLSWLQVIVLILYNLQTRDIYTSTSGYFNQQLHIATFVEDYWDVFFDKHTEKEINLLEKVESTLSQFNNIFFLSGEKVHAQPGWWRLKYPELTPSATLSLYSVCSNVKEKTEEKRDPLTDTEMSESVLQENIQHKSSLEAVDESPRPAHKVSPHDVENSSTISKQKQKSTETISSLNLLKSCTIESNSFDGSSTSYKPLSDDSASTSKPSTVSERKRRSSGTMTSSPLKLFKSCSNEDALLRDPLTSYNPLSDSVSASKLSTTPEHELRSTETMSLSPRLLESCSVEDNSLGVSCKSYKSLSDPASASKSVTISKRQRRKIAMMSLPPLKLFISLSKLQQSYNKEEDLLGNPSTNYSPLSDPASASKQSRIPILKLKSTKTTSPSGKCSKEDGSLSGTSTSYEPPSHPASSSKSAAISKRKRKNIEIMSLSPSKLHKSHSKEEDLLDNPSTSYNPLSNPAHGSKSSTISEHKLKPKSKSRKLLDFCSKEDDSLSGPSTSHKSPTHPASPSKSATIPKRKRKNIGITFISPSKLPKSHSKEEDLRDNPSTSYNPLSNPAHGSKSSTISGHKLKIKSKSRALLDTCEKSTQTMFSSSSPDSEYPSTHSSSHDSTSSSSSLYHFNTCMTPISKVRHMKLTEGLTDGNRRGLIESPYSGIFLSPYIWRDAETFPPWLQLMCQIRLKSNQHIEDYVVPPRAPIDYVYVQPEHIPAVNSLCNQYLCSDIDMTESLQHPEFSCIVLYKRLVVAFAFIIPNVSRSKHYLSHIFTRPGWRGVGIAKRMLYFLLKNSAGKDVTLHVSFDNVAIYMYQKFGFKVERIEKKFYENYVRIKKKESTDALFCRRERSHSGDI